MSPSLRFLVLAFFLSTVLIMAPAAFGAPTIVNFDFGAVRILCGGGYTYQWLVNRCGWGLFQDFNSTRGFGWTLSQVPASYAGGSGLTGPNTRFSPPPFTQAVFLQDRPSFVWQAVGGFTAGGYTLSFYLGSRYTSGQYDGNQTVEALIDGNVIGTWALSSFTPFTLETAPFTVGADGSHTLEFRGINPGDHTAFLSYVVITSD